MRKRLLRATLCFVPGTYAEAVPGSRPYVWVGKKSGEYLSAFTEKELLAMLRIVRRAKVRR